MAAVEGAGPGPAGRAVIRRMTIEELAERAGMTVRNVREHQTRGLLPPPALVGRKGFYDERHLARLLLVRQLQEEGLNLHAVGWLLEQAPPEASAEVARLKQALFAPWATERPRTYTLAELVERFGEEAGAGARARAEELGLLERVDQTTWVSPAPRLLEAGAQLVELGVEVGAALDVVEQLTESLSSVARSFVELFVAEILSPGTAADARPAPVGGGGGEEEPPPGRGERTVAIGEAVERLRPIASEAVLAAFQLRMDELVSRTFGPGGGLEGGGEG